MQTVKMPGFMNMCLKYGCEDYVLKNTSLVIDGQNFLCNSYIDSGCGNIFGIDCDKYASYLRLYLGKFKDVCIRLYFLFKGGREGITLYILYKGGPEVITDDELEKLNRVSNTTPILMKEVFMQVLDELKIDYVVCEYGAKNDAIALARELNCPVLSDDVRFCFSHVLYIPYSTGKFNTQGLFMAKGFTLERFMKELNIKIGHVAILFVIFNFFDINIFKGFFKRTRTHYNQETVLLWLSRHSVERAREVLCEFIGEPNGSLFLQYEEEALRLISNDIGKSAALQFLENRNTFKVSPEDREWFTKGVCLKRVPTQYVNLYRLKVMFCSLVMEDIQQEEALLFSRYIIRYAYDLLTNFDGSTFNIVSRNIAKVKVGTEYSISRPKGCADGSESVFSVGWDSQPRLFEHFLQTHLGTDLDVLSALSDDVQLVAVAAVYFARARGAARQPQMYAVFACCAALRSEVLPLVQTEDIDMSLLHSLVQYQHCLQQLNFLNRLCGSRLPPTKYADCYNATLVYSLALQAANALDPYLYLRELLLVFNASLDVIQCYDTLVDYYDEFNVKRFKSV